MFQELLKRISTSWGRGKLLLLDYFKKKRILKVELVGVLRGDKL